MGGKLTREQKIKNFDLKVRLESQRLRLKAAYYGDADDFEGNTATTTIVEMDRRTAIATIEVILRQLEWPRTKKIALSWAGEMLVESDPS